MPARVVLPAAVPICVIVAPPLPLPGYGRLHADSGRRAGPAGRWRVSTSGAVRRAALASTGSGEGVPVVDVGLRSRHRKPRCVCGETAPSRSTSERRIDRTIGLPLYIVGPVSWRTCAGGHHARQLFGDGPAGQRTRPDQVRYAGHQPQVDGDRAACWQPCGRRRRSRKCRRQPRVVGGEDDQLTAACSFLPIRDRRHVRGSPNWQVSAVRARPRRRRTEAREPGRAVQPAALAPADPPSRPPKSVGKPDGYLAGFGAGPTP